MMKTAASVATILVTALAGLGLAAVGGYQAHQPATVVRVVKVTTTITPKPVVKIKYRTRWRTRPAPAQAPSPPTTADWSMQIDCSQVQCTTYPGAGPYGGTCQPPVNGMQWCYGKPTGNPSDPCSVSGLCR